MIRTEPSIATILVAIFSGTMLGFFIAWILSFYETIKRRKQVYNQASPIAIQDVYEKLKLNFQYKNLVEITCNNQDDTIIVKTKNCKYEVAIKNQHLIILEDMLPSKMVTYFSLLTLLPQIILAKEARVVVPLLVNSIINAEVLNGTKNLVTASINNNKSNTISAESPRTSKNSLMKRVLIVSFTVFVILGITYTLFYGGESTAYELTQMTSMTKQEIIDKFGIPDEVIYDEEQRYFYIYNFGIVVYGTNEGAYDITLSKDLIKNNSLNNYKMLDVYIDSSFDENILRLGTPNVIQTIDGKKNAMYLTQEEYLIIITTAYNSDEIARIQTVFYDESPHFNIFDLSQLLGEIITEEELDKTYTIIDKSSFLQTITYVLNGFQLIVDADDHRVLEIFIAQRSIYNILGLRTKDSLNKANKVLGMASGTSDGISNTTRYTFENDDYEASYSVELSINNNSKEIDYIGILLKNANASYVPDYNFERSSTFELTLDKIFQPFLLNFEGTDNSLYSPEYRYYEIYDETDWTATDIQVMESLFIECAYLGVICFESTGSFEEDVLSTAKIESEGSNNCYGRCVPYVDYAIPIENKYWPYINDMYKLFAFYAYYYLEHYDPEPPNLNKMSDEKYNYLRNEHPGCFEGQDIESIETCLYFMTNPDKHQEYIEYWEAISGEEN